MYFILEGAFNGHIKFLFYLIGLFIAIMLGILLRGSGKLNIPDETTGKPHKWMILLKNV